MEQLTKEQICDKVEKLTRELTSYQAMLDEIYVQEESKFSIKIKSMVGGYFMRDLSDSNLYCRIDNVIKIADSYFNGLYVEYEGAIVSIPKYTNCRYIASVDRVYIDERDLADYKPITKGEFDAVVAQFTKKFKGQ